METPRTRKLALLAALWPMVGCSAVAADPESDGGGELPSTLVPVEDPNPGVIEAGEHRACEAGPDSTETTFDLGDVADTQVVLTGTVKNASAKDASLAPGRFFVSSGDQVIGGNVGLDDRDNFSVQVPLFCGPQTIKFVWTNDACETVVVYTVNRTTCAEEDIRVTLSWDGLGEDLELHLIKPGGRINDLSTDCFWKSCILAAKKPDWGIPGDTSDDPLKDVDDTDLFGPENIFLAKPENGTYTVMVEHWGGGSDETDATVVINVRGTKHVQTRENIPWGRIWTVATIDWPSGTVKRGASELYDCSSEWDESCKAPIP